MRRKDKEISDKELIESLLQRADVCRIAMCNNNIPYVVPVNFGYKDNRLYFHSAREGRKIDMIKQNNHVCFEIDIDVELVKKSGTPCSGTMKYYSVIGFGKATIIEDPVKKREALDIIVSHYLSGNSYDYLEELLNRILIIKVDISSITGKKSGY